MRKQTIFLSLQKSCIQKKEDEIIFFFLFKLNSYINNLLVLKSLNYCLGKLASKFAIFGYSPVTKTQTLLSCEPIDL